MQKTLSFSQGQDSYLKFQSCSEQTKVTCSRGPLLFGMFTPHNLVALPHSELVALTYCTRPESTLVDCGHGTRDSSALLCYCVALFVPFSESLDSSPTLETLLLLVLVIL